MKRAKPSFLLVALILVALPLGLWGAVTATYTPEIPIYFTKSPGVFTQPTIIGAKIGTITMVSEGPIYNPGLMTIGEFSGNIPMYAYHRNWDGVPYTKKSFNFYFVVVAYPYGRGGSMIISTPHETKWPIAGATTGVTINVSPFYVDLYIINSNPSNVSNPSSVVGYVPLPEDLEPGSSITFVNPFNPYFTVGVGSDSTNGVYNYAQGPGGSLTQGTENGSYVPIDGVSGADSTPLVDEGSFTSGENQDDGFWFGDNPPKPLNFLFSFLHNTVNFDLSDAYEGKSDLYLNTARMVVENGVTGTTYKQKITFTDIWGGPTFQLKPDQDSDGIDFNLVFGSKPVNYGDGDDWENLVPGPNNEKILYIKGIKPSQVNQRVSGEYTDTIIVNITAADN